MNEKYIPLYRKYRPQKLEEVVGQEHIKQALSNAIAMDKISHAYLFTGRAEPVKLLLQEFLPNP